MLKEMTLTTFNVHVREACRALKLIRQTYKSVPAFFSSKMMLSHGYCHLSCTNVEQVLHLFCGLRISQAMCEMGMKEFHIFSSNLAKGLNQHLKFLVLISLYFYIMSSKFNI